MTEVSGFRSILSDTEPASSVEPSHWTRPDYVQRRSLLKTTKIISATSRSIIICNDAQRAGIMETSIQQTEGINR